MIELSDDQREALERLADRDDLETSRISQEILAQAD